jgi:hypothetical protein
VFPAALKRHLSNKSDTAAEHDAAGAADAEPAAAAGALRPKTPTPGKGVRNQPDMHTLHLYAFDLPFQ